MLSLQLMGIQTGERQLYMTVILQALRGYYKRRDAETTPLALSSFVDAITRNTSFSESQRYGFDTYMYLNTVQQ